MAIKNQLDALLQEKMDRKDFLKYAGGVVLAVIGVTGMVRMLLGSRSITGLGDGQTNGAKKLNGYGSSSYGK